MNVAVQVSIPVSAWNSSGHVLRSGMVDCTATLCLIFRCPSLLRHTLPQLLPFDFHVGKSSWCVISCGSGLGLVSDHLAKLWDLTPSLQVPCLDQSWSATLGPGAHLLGTAKTVAVRAVARGPGRTLSEGVRSRTLSECAYYL